MSTQTDTEATTEAVETEETTAEETTEEATTDAAEAATDTDTNEEDKKGEEPKGKKTDLVDRRELTKVIAERQDAKKKLREKEQELEKIRRANEGESERVQRETREAAIAEIEGKYKPLVVRAAAKAELLDAGAPKDAVDQMFEDFIRVEEVEVDERGAVSGVDAQVLAAKEKYPMLFTAAPAVEEPPVKKVKVTAKAADGADKPAPKKKLSAEERAMRMLQGKPA